MTKPLFSLFVLFLLLTPTLSCAQLNPCQSVLKVYNKPLKVSGVAEGQKAIVQKCHKNYLISQQQQLHYQLVDSADAEVFFEGKYAQINSSDENGRVKFFYFMFMYDAKVDGLRWGGVNGHRPKETYVENGDYLAAFQSTEVLYRMLGSNAQNITSRQSKPQFANPIGGVIVKPLEVEEAIVKELGGYADCVEQTFFNGLIARAQAGDNPLKDFEQILGQLNIGTPSSPPPFVMDKNLPIIYIQPKIRQQGEYYVVEIYDENGEYMTDTYFIKNI